MFDWQTIVAACVLVAACVYTGWRSWLGISSLSSSKRNAPSCDKSCAGCGGELESTVILGKSTIPSELFPNHNSTISPAEKVLDASKTMRRD